MHHHVDRPCKTHQHPSGLETRTRTSSAEVGSSILVKKQDFYYGFRSVKCENLSKSKIQPLVDDL